MYAALRTLMDANWTEFLDRHPNIQSLTFDQIVDLMEKHFLEKNPLVSQRIRALKMKMEQPIRAFTRKMNGMTGLNYHERLAKLKMLSMERRRERFILINMFKILKVTHF